MVYPTIRCLSRVAQGEGEKRGIGGYLCSWQCDEYCSLHQRPFTILDCSIHNRLHGIFFDFHNIVDMQDYAWSSMVFPTPEDPARLTQLPGSAVRQRGVMICSL